METTVYNSKGIKTGKITLPESVFGLSWNADLVHQVVIAQQENKRFSTAHTKDRSEVRGGGKKPWAQKGTGRARHGSNRSPIWRGGGITFGPRSDKKYGQKINKKMKAKALCTVLSRKLKDGEIIFVDSLSYETPKTKEAQAFLNTLGGNFDTFNKAKNAALITMPEWHECTARSFRNIGNVLVNKVQNLSPLEALSSKYLVFVNPAETISFFETKCK